jgi:hypothetical protein
MELRKQYSASITDKRLKALDGVPLSPRGVILGKRAIKLNFHCLCRATIFFVILR